MLILAFVDALHGGASLKYLEVRISLSIENQIPAMVGSFLLLSLLLAHFYSPYWLLLTTFIGVILLQSNFSGFYLMDIILRKLQNKPQ